MNRGSGICQKVEVLADGDSCKTTRLAAFGWKWKSLSEYWGVASRRGISLGVNLHRWRFRRALDKGHSKAGYASDGRIRIGRHGCGVGADRTVPAASEQAGTAFGDGPARGVQCDPVHACDGLSAARITEVLSAPYDRPVSLLRVEWPGHLGPDDACVAVCSALRSGSEGGADGCGDRHPEREDDGEWRPARIRRGKRAKGRKRHITVDAEGFPIVAHVHLANVQDRNGAPTAIVDMLEVAPKVEKLFADGGYRGPKLRGKLEQLTLSDLVEIDKKPKRDQELTVLCRRWVVERKLAWLNRCRRLAKDIERTNGSSAAWEKLAACRLLMRWLVRS